jgi:SAM-dependent methyltransferase
VQFGGLGGLLGGHSLGVGGGVLDPVEAGDLGNGRAGIALSERNIEYHGIDVMKPCIDFCKDAFITYPNFKFYLMDIWNADSNPNGKMKSIDFTLPFKDEYFDNVIVYSVFTHLQYIEVAARYVMEIKRVLKSGGLFLSTWYRSPPNENHDPITGRTVYLEHDIMTVLSGFYFLKTYGGNTNQFYDQWCIFAKKP